MAGANPTLRQRQLARQLRELREQVGLNIKDVADRVLLSPGQISRIETAKRRPSLRDVRALCELYGVPDGPLMKLAREAHEQGWWQELEDVDFRPLPGLENDAVAISEYETTTIPGLLQTPDYARAIIKGYLPQIEPDVLDARVDGRMKRQEILSKANPPRYWVVLDESALHRHIGGPAVMAQQLAQVAMAAEQPHITIQVVPYTNGAHMGLDSAFMLLEFAPEASLADTVYMETLAGQIFTERPRQLERFNEVLDHLRAVALSPQESVARILAQGRWFETLA
ncbi:helix-turn-helix domain-containing protein [Nonomuraea soli]|uniref:Transcriptional regulator with XRE-family HTH domain n=1 Tax=Nonomuraea soli TaxID=1032476 RepID=A0A7W0CKQ5_9ACTN|nr:helix-turn-helix transcriptional regulator [Nonomuraea soli]MBA2892984.1 transcriptional regulator with XRE-family HTH domain [Nonomuraea soli]